MSEEISISDLHRQVKALRRRLKGHSSELEKIEGRVRYLGSEVEVLTNEARLRSMPSNDELIEDLKGQVAALEKLRPQWAQGFTDDSIAAQVTVVALESLYGLLGVDNQTDAVKVLKQLKAGAARYRWLRDIGDYSWVPFEKQVAFSGAQADEKIDRAIKEMENSLLKEES